MDNRKPGVGVSVIIMKNDKVLLGKRKGSHGSGTWAFPGGHIEFMEDWLETCKREVKEETNLDVKMIDRVPCAATNDFFKEDDKHYITLFFKANIMGGELRLMESEKCLEWRWFEWNNLPELLFIPVKNLIKQGFKL